MANFTAAKIGGWSFGQKFASWQLTQLQEMLLKCPNFSEGSSHTLTGTLTIGATGAGSVTISAPLTLSGSTTITGTLDVQGLEKHSNIFYDGITNNVTLYSYKRNIWVRTTNIGLAVISGFDGSIPVDTEFTVYNCGGVEINFRANADHYLGIPKYSMRRYRKVDNNSNVNSYVTVVTNSGL